MKKTALTIILFASITMLFAQTTTAQEPPAQVSAANGTAGKKILFAFEESNEKLDPWLSRFNVAFVAANVNVDKKAASELASVDFSKYDLIVVYGAVMAFTSKEPLREWLTKENRLAGNEGCPVRHRQPLVFEKIRRPAARPPEKKQSHCGRRGIGRDERP